MILTKHWLIEAWEQKFWADNQEAYDKWMEKQCGNEAQGEKARATDSERGKEVCEGEGLHD